MKTVASLWPDIPEMNNLRLAAWKAAKGKRYAPGVLRFFADLDNQLLSLRTALIRNEMTFGDYRTFTVFEPKPRLIAAPAFREQVVHHAVMNYCDPHFEKRQIFDSYASRRGKGVLAALQRARSFQRKYHYALKLDVKDFFGSIHHDTVRGQLRKLFRERPLLELYGRILDSYERTPGRGLPIGTLVSQYLANHYLCSLDHYAKEELRCRAYVRYMDDMVIWHDDPAFLRATHRALRRYVRQQLQQDLKPPVLQACSRGLPFLGFVLYPHHLRLTRASKRRLIKRAEARHRELMTGEKTAAETARRVQCLLAFADYGDTTALRRELYERLNTTYGTYE